LHVTLSGETVPAPSELAPDCRLPNVDALAARAFAGRLPLAAIAAEIERQYDRFEAMTGRRPDFVDGHQHVHVLPGIRRLFLAAARRRAPDAWIRTCEESAATIWRRAAFRWTALRSSLLSRGLSAQAERIGLRTNLGFAGLYDFRARPDYGALFGRWLVGSGVRPLIICHPSRPDAADPIGAARVEEYRFLASSQAAALLAQAGLSLEGPAHDR
ncbi:MAG: hypothetical protein JWO25_2481, partial [Alphaproteobacteria bacterium]|nr:hypothetical protein [Alphaproteobacteria bacterium]